MALTTFFSFRERQLPGQGRDRRWMPAFLFFIALVALLVGLYSAYWTPDKTAPIAITSAIIAAVAILYNALHSARQARIRFTLEATFQRFSNSTYASHAAVIYRFRDEIEGKLEADLKALTTGSSGSKDAPSAAESLIYVLNYWEFVATAYVDGHLDRETFADVVGQFIESLVQRTCVLIGELRTRPSDNGNPGEIWEHLVAAYFRHSTENHRKKYVPRLGPAPWRLSDHERYLWDKYQAKA